MSYTPTNWTTTTNGVTLTVNPADGTVRVVAPFEPDMPALARQIGGKFINGAWLFDGRDEARVRDMLREVYGTDGTPVPAVTVRVALGVGFNDYSPALFLFGRKLAERRDRDSRVTLGPGAIVVEGGFDSRGGSVKNPRLAWKSGTVLEVRDVPAGHPELAAFAEAIDLVVPDAEPGASRADRAALAAERGRLLARVAEIDAALAQPEPED